VGCVPHLDLVTIVVSDYDDAVRWFVDVFGFVLAEDEPSLTTDGRPKRWVVVRPPGGGTGLLLARADAPEQRAAVGRQTGGRVGFFLRVDDVDAVLEGVGAAGGTTVRPPRDEPYGRVAVVEDLAGNRWDLLGPVS
jgi:predicted enzyme related to lactoylglutathione lyase